MRYLDYKVPVGCDGEVYIVVKGREKRITEYFVAVGGEKGGPRRGGTEGVASEGDVKEWAKGEVAGVGKLCEKRGIWEKE